MLSYIEKVENIVKNIDNFLNTEYIFMDSSKAERDIFISSVISNYIEMLKRQCTYELICEIVYCINYLNRLSCTKTYSSNREYYYTSYIINDEVNIEIRNYKGAPASIHLKLYNFKNKIFDKLKNKVFLMDSEDHKILIDVFQRELIAAFKNYVLYID